jgi:hypothetical protein
MSWYRITFPFPDEQALQTAFALVASAGQREKQHNAVGFAIFDAPEFYEDDPHRSSQVYYFSPVAAELCSDLIAPFSPTPCGAPDRNLFNLGLAYVTLQGSESWDLLK